jgi:hypothetical protein
VTWNDQRAIERMQIESAMETRSEDRTHRERQLPRAEGKQHDCGKLHALENHSDVDARD